MIDVSLLLALFLNPAIFATDNHMEERILELLGRKDYSPSNVPELLKRLGLSIGDMDVIEINEAFAAQALPVLRELGLADDAPHVNPNGGAIALGHPLGMSGARLAMTATEELCRGGGRYALCAMCIGVGQGIALLIERCGTSQPG